VNLIKLFQNNKDILKIIWKNKIKTLYYNILQWRQSYKAFRMKHRHNIKFSTKTFQPL